VCVCAWKCKVVITGDEIHYAKKTITRKDKNTFPTLTFTQAQKQKWNENEDGKKRKEETRKKNRAKQKFCVCVCVIRTSCRWVVRHLAHPWR
jgi:L-lactate utilization protein LutC